MKWKHTWDSNVCWGKIENFPRFVRGKREKGDENNMKLIYVLHYVAIMQIFSQSIRERDEKMNENMVEI